MKKNGWHKKNRSEFFLLKKATCGNEVNREASENPIL